MEVVKETMYTFCFVCDAVPGHTAVQSQSDTVFSADWLFCQCDCSSFGFVSGVLLPTFTGV